MSGERGVIAPLARLIWSVQRGSQYGAAHRPVGQVHSRGGKVGDGSYRPSARGERSYGSYRPALEVRRATAHTGQAPPAMTQTGPSASWKRLSEAAHSRHRRAPTGAAMPEVTQGSEGVVVVPESSQLRPTATWMSAGLPLPSGPARVRGIPSSPAICASNQTRVGLELPLRRQQVGTWSSLQGYGRGPTP